MQYIISWPSLIDYFQRLVYVMYNNKKLYIIFYSRIITYIYKACSCSLLIRLSKNFINIRVQQLTNISDINCIIYYIIYLLIVKKYNWKKQVLFLFECDKSFGKNKEITVTQILVKLIAWRLWVCTVVSISLFLKCKVKINW